MPYIFIRYSVINRIPSCHNIRSLQDHNEADPLTNARDRRRRLVPWKSIYLSLGSCTTWFRRSTVITPADVGACLGRDGSSIALSVASTVHSFSIALFANPFKFSVWGETKTDRRGSKVFGSDGEKWYVTFLDGMDGERRVVQR